MDLRIAKGIANKALKEHKLYSWSFKFDTAKRRCGLCNFRTKTLSTSRILTRMNDERFFTDTLLHEIAHALVGRNHGHDNTWKSMALSLGSTPLSKCVAKINTPKRKYIYHCPNCLTETGFHRKIKSRYACKSCCIKYNSGKYKDEYIFVEGRAVK